MGGIEIVVDGVAFVGWRFHGVWRRALLGEVHHGVRLPALNQREEVVVVLGDIKLDKLNLPIAYLSPGIDTLIDRLNRRQGLHTQLFIDTAPGQVIDYQDLMAFVGKVQCCWPAAEAISTQYHHFHNISLTATQVSIAE